MRFKTSALIRITAYGAMALTTVVIKEGEAIGAVSFAVLAALLVQYFLGHVLLVNDRLRLALLVFSGGVGACIGGRLFGGSVMTQPSDVLIGIFVGSIVWGESNVTS